MPELGDEVRNDEERTKKSEEDESKFPMWIIPLVAGPIILIILIVLLASNQPGGNNDEIPEGFNQPRLMKEAINFQSEATKFYHEAQKHQDQKKRNEFYDKALDVSEKALMNIEKIREYFEEKGIEKEQGGVWDWEKLEQEICQLRIDITRDHGF